MTYRTILAAVDGTEFATRALERAASIAKAVGASLSIVTVSPPPPTFASSEIGWSVPASVYDQIRTASAAAAEKVFADSKAISAVPIKDAIHVENIEPAEGILDVANKLGADLIVMGSHGHRGINRLLLGSQAAKVLSQSKVSVLIVK